MEESSSSQDHGELTRVVGVVEPGLMVEIPRMVSPWETDDAISGLTPHSDTHHRTEKNKQHESFKTLPEEFDTRLEVS